MIEYKKDIIIVQGEKKNETAISSVNIKTFYTVYEKYDESKL